MRPLRGFTLIEMVMVIVLMGIIIAVIAPLAAQPFRAYQASKDRAQLVSLADQAFFLMQRDIHAALPNSIRVNSTGTAFELIHVVSAGRYRAQDSGLTGSDTLDFTTADSSFQVAGPFTQPPAGSQLVIYHTGQTGADAYAGDAVITPAGTTLTVTNNNPESLITLSSAHQFPYPSPMQRFYVVDTPITYMCKNSQLWRYDQYSLQTTVASPPPSARASLVSDQVGSCQFSYQPGTASRAGLISVQLVITGQNEQLSIMEQANVPNGI